MKYTVYQITNNVNGKIYIGIHKTLDINDGYMGSGKALNAAYEKYGVENFTKELLAVFDNPEDMFNMESELVNQDFVLREDTYNINVGGNGGWDAVNAMLTSEDKSRFGKMADRAPALDKLRWLSENDEEWLAEFKKRVKQGLLEKYPNGRVGTFTGKTHTQETKDKMSASSKGKCLGKENGSYGTCWIHNDRENKKIKKNELNSWLDQGWIKGRKMKFDVQ